jgi:hypothetical protein
MARIKTGHVIGLQCAADRPSVELIRQANPRAAPMAPMKPFLGYLMLLEHDAASTKSVRENEPHYEVLPEFKNASYAKRYQIFCEKAFREGLYDSTAFLMSNQAGGLKGEFIEPSAELSFKNLAAAIYGRAVAYCKQRAS